MTRRSVGATAEQAPTAAAPPTHSGGLLAVIERLAKDPALNMETFERLLAARRSEEDRAAERAFHAAMAAARGEIEPVLKKRDVDFPSKSGAGRTKYKYEELADVQRAVDPVFQKHGLSYRFAVEQPDYQHVHVSCVVSHALGHSIIGSPLKATIDPGNTGMSMVQALGSAITYLQRYSLRSAIGLAAGKDDDGLAAGGAAVKIDAAQANELQRLIEETGSSQPTMLRLFGVDELGELTVEQWTRAKEVLGLRKAEQRKARVEGANNAPGF